MNTNEINKTIDDTNEIIEYVHKYKPHICFLTPCYGGLCHINYMISMMNTIKLLTQFGIQYTLIYTASESLITRARNNLIAKALYNINHTHIMFIDSDIKWDPVDIIRLLLDNKSIVGGLYPIKNYDFKKFTNPSHALSNIPALLEKKKTVSYLSNVSDHDLIQHNLLRYNTNFNSNEVSVDNGLIEVKHLATGFMMIQRDTLLSLMANNQELKYVDDVNFLSVEENDYAYALFDCGIIDGHYFSEDWMFCHRWFLSGGLIYANVNIKLTHSGVEEYTGNFLSTII